MLLCAWASVNMQSEPEVRTVLFATGTVMAYILSATIPLAAYPASQAPKWKIGAKVYLGFAIFSIFVYVGIYFGFAWEKKRKLRQVAGENTMAPSQVPERVA